MRPSAKAVGANARRCMSQPANLAACSRRARLRANTAANPRPPSKDPRGTHRVANVSMHIGRPLLGQRVDDLLTAADVLSARDDVEAVHLIGLHNAGPVALHAAALDERFASLSVRESISSWVEDVVAKPLGHHLLGHVVPGALQKYDLPDLVRAIAPRKVD